MAKRIPDDIKAQATQLVLDYNKKHDTTFLISFRGKYAYLDKKEMIRKPSFAALQDLFAGKFEKLKAKKGDNAREVITKLGRLKFNGKIDDWSFDVYKYSREAYDPDEFMFPGIEHLDGTIAGACKAGMVIY